MTTQTLSSLSPSQLLESQASADPALLIDIRSRRSFRQHHIEGSHNIPLPLLLSQEWPDGDWIVLADDNPQAQQSIGLLHDSGYGRSLQWLDGGLTHWRELELPLAGVQPPIVAVAQEPVTVAALLAGGAVLVGLQLMPVPVLLLSFGLLLGPAIAARVLPQVQRVQLKHLA